MNPHVGTVEIKTDRLLLRRFRAEDAESFFANYGSDPEVHKYVNFVPCTTLEDTKAFIQKHIDKYDKDPKYYRWAVDLNGEVIGYTGLFHLEESDDSAEFKFSFGSKFWWLGYSTEFAKAVRDFAFETVGIHRLYATHHVDNRSSGTTYLNIGMDPEGTMRGGHKNPDGTYSDLRQYSVLSTDKLDDIIKYIVK